MRKTFSELLMKQMSEDDRIYLITADLGYGFLDKIIDAFPDRAFNVGAAEQLMIGSAIGLASDGKIPFCYSITPFLLYRPFEFLRTYVNHEKIPIKLIGSGRADNYRHDGFSHHAFDDDEIIGSLKNIKIYKPLRKEDIPTLWDEFVYNNKPGYLNLSK
jgi:transketolase